MPQTTPITLLCWRFLPKGGHGGLVHCNICGACLSLRGLLRRPPQSHRLGLRLLRCARNDTHHFRRYGLLASRIYHRLARSVDKVTSISAASRTLSPLRSKPTSTVICRSRSAVMVLSVTLHKYEPSRAVSVSPNDAS